MALRGIKVVEMAGLAPGPFCGMVLADHGARVVRVDKVKAISQDTLARGKQSIAVNLKRVEGVEVVRRLCDSADVLIEPFRTGVMEKLGLGPDVLCSRNKGLVYARLTGFGQSGPYARMAGHDINYIATSGVLSVMGRKGEPPYAPINLLADFAGGGLMCSLGIMMALFERTKSGKGQVIDANMVQGSAYVSAFLWSSRQINLWERSRGENLLDGGAAFYDTYQTKDGKYMAVGALEPQFYEKLLQGLQLDPNEFSQFSDNEALAKRFSQVFRSRTQAEWVAIFDGTDACVTPVLTRDNAATHPHNAGAFLTNDMGEVEPAPAPKLSRTPASVKSLQQPMVGDHTVSILQEAGFHNIDIDELLASGIVQQTQKSRL